MSEHDGTRREGPPSTRDPTRLGGEATAGAVTYLARGTLIDRYVVLEVAGEGGMGVVDRAFDPELDRKAAIKLLQTTRAELALVEGSGADGQHYAELAIANHEAAGGAPTRRCAGYSPRSRTSSSRPVTTTPRSPRRLRAGDREPGPDPR